MTANWLMKLFRQPITKFLKIMPRCCLRLPSILDKAWLFLTRALFYLSSEMTTLLEKDFKIDNKEILPPHEFLYDDASSGCHSHNYLARSAVIPSLPLTIKWLRDCVRDHPSTRLQVTIIWMVLDSYIWLGWCMDTQC